MPPQIRLGLSCADCGSAGFSSLIAGAASGAVSGAISGVAFAVVSGACSTVSGFDCVESVAALPLACNESVGDAVVGSYDVIAYLSVIEGVSTACGVSVEAGISAGDGASGGISEAFGSCAAGSVTSWAESQHGKSSRNAKESTKGCFKVFLLIENRD